MAEAVDNAALFQRLARFTRSEPQERHWAEVRTSIESFIERNAAESGAGFDDSPEVMEAAALVLEIAENAAKPEFVRLCLTLLARLGRFGRLLLTGFLEDQELAFPEVSGFLDELGELEQLEVIDRFCLLSRRENAEFAEESRQRLNLLGKEGQATGMEFYQRHAGQVPAPSFAVRECLRRGAFGAECRRRALQRMTTEASQVLQTALQWFDDTELLVSVAARLSHWEPGAAAGILHSMSWLGRDMPRAVVENVRSLAQSPDLEVRVAALTVLTACGPEDMDEIFSRAVGRDEDIHHHVLLRLPVLQWETYERFLGLLGPEERRRFFLRMYAVLARLDPGGLADLLHQRLEAAKENGMAPKSAMVLAESLPRDTGRPAVKPDIAKAGRPAPRSMLSRLVSGVLRLGRTDDSLSFQVHAHRFSGRSFSAMYVVNFHFLETTFRNTDFSESTLAHDVFEKCTFDHVSFRDAELSHVRFVNCTFHRCDFTRARLFGIKISAATLDKCAFHASTLSDVAATAVALTHSWLVKSEVVNSRLSTCTMRGNIAVSTAMERMHFNGVALLDSHFSDCRLQRCRLRNLQMEAATFRDCRARGLVTNHPVLLELETRTLEAEVNRAARELRGAPVDGRLSRVGKRLEYFPMPRGLDQEGTKLAGRVVRLWFRRKELLSLEKSFVANNERRISWGVEKLGPRGREFFLMLPLLLHCDEVAREFGLDQDLSASRIKGYRPDLTGVEMARKHLSRVRLPRPNPRALIIEAVYTIGSLGTMAQSGASDLDYWVCCDLANAPAERVAALKAKLDAVSKWAEERFELEVYFFLMDVAAVHANNFGFSDRESSGSAQALLLKEEFYRTAVWVAGKEPVWWLVPPGQDEQGYAQARKRFAVLPEGARFIDLGHVHRIPSQEFFGASLWQIVKALKSPFKSVMKLGLLERYVSGNGETKKLLCNELKESIYWRNRRLWEIDPYAIMFRELVRFYDRMQDQDTVDLLHTSFYMKTGIAGQVQDMVFPLRREEQHMAGLHGKSVFPGQYGFSRLDRADHSDLDHQLALGRAVNQYVVNTYVRVRDKQAEADAMINPQDLTKLGRKIQATYAKSRDKVEHFPFIEVQKGTLTHLVFAANRYVATDPTWIVSAGNLDTKNNRFNLKELRKTPNLAWLLSWLVVNHLYRPGVAVKADMTISPVTTGDIARLLEDLLAHFPPKQTFDTDINENLKTEEIVRAMIIINLNTQRELCDIREVSVAWSTNWGEMFCRSFPTEDNDVKIDPQGFLYRHLRKTCAPDIRIRFFTPANSQCRLAV